MQYEASHSYDFVVVGGGLVGAAIATGLLEQGLYVAIVDEGDVAYRASRGNFGLIWTQGKGDGMPPYGEWTRRSADLWPDLAARLSDEEGIDVAHSRPGGLHICLGEEEFADRAALMKRMSNSHGPAYEYEMIDRPALEKMLPGLGLEVSGASFSSLDGHANSLKLYKSLHRRFARLGGAYRSNHRARRIHLENGGVRLDTEGGIVAGKSLLLAAGNGTPELARQVGLDIPVRPQRGQVLVTERAEPFLNLPTALVRQTDEGSVLIGDSKEEVGFDESVTGKVTADIARRAVSTFPFLKRAKVVRSWAALRIMTPDGHPIYAQHPEHSNVFAACVHSGVTLAAAHAGPFAEALARGALPDGFECFAPERFRVHA